MRRLRTSGLTWLVIGEKVGRDGASCRIRITRQLHEPDPLRGAVVPRPRRVEAAPMPTPAPAALAATSLRYAMDAGDPISWGAITAGTLLCWRRSRTGERWDHHARPQRHVDADGLTPDQLREMALQLRRHGAAIKGWIC